MGKSGDKQRRISNKWYHASASGTIKIKTGLSTQRVKLVIYRSVGSASKPVMCSFLVSAQETNQRKRPGEALSAKSFATADFNHIVSPTLSHPPPDPLPARVGSQVLVDFIVNPSTFIPTTGNPLGNGATNWNLKSSNVTEQSERVTIIAAPCTHRLSAHADKLKFAQQYRTGWAQWCNE